jgi:hypothetical protein
VTWLKIQTRAAVRRWSLLGRTNCCHDDVTLRGEATSVETGKSAFFKHQPRRRRGGALATAGVAASASARYHAHVFPVTLIHAKASQFGLEYLVIGGQAVNTFGVPRSTLDVDLLVCRDHRKQWAALLEGEGFRRFRDDENFMQFSPPYGVSWRLDLMLVNANTFARLAADARAVTCLGVETRVPSAEHLIALKLHSMHHGPADRFGRDFTDILTLARAANLEAEAPTIRALFEKYGTPEIYDRFREALKS